MKPHCFLALSVLVSISSGDVRDDMMDQSQRELRWCWSCGHGRVERYNWIRFRCACEPGWKGDCCDERADVCEIVYDGDYDYTYSKPYLSNLPFHKTVPESAEFTIEYNYNLLVQSVLPVVINVLFVGRCAQQQEPSHPRAGQNCDVPSQALKKKLEEIAADAKNGGVDGIEFSGFVSTIFAFLLLLREEALLGNAGDLISDVLTCDGVRDGVDSIEVLISFTRCMIGDSQLYGQNAPAKLSDFHLSTHDSFFQTVSPPKEVADAFFEDTHDIIGTKWMSDDTMFGYIRLIGPNPDMIRSANLVDVRSNVFPVTNEMFQAVMGESKTLGEAIDLGEVFILDFQALEDHEIINNGKILFSPKVLFALDKSDILQTIAIQVYSNPSRPNNKLILPPKQRDWSSATSSEKVELAKWSLAKTAVQSADMAYFELVTHLARTHLAVEPLIIATKHKLSDTHPVRRLLEPHFVGTISRNDGAYNFFLPDHVIDWFFPPTIESAQSIAVTATREFLQNINDQFLPKSIKRRGFEQLPRSYPYRDDALLHWDALRDFIMEFLSVSYANDDAVLSDAQLRCWATELSERAMMNNFGTEGMNEFQTIEDLGDFLSLFVFTATVQHASVNYPQATLGVFAPIMPTSGWIDPNDITEENVMDLPWTERMPPSRWQALGQINVGKALGSVHYNILGHYNDGYGRELFTGGHLSAVQSYRQRLVEIGSEIEGRNTEPNTLRNDLWQYTLLHPNNVPESIHI